MLRELVIGKSLDTVFDKFKGFVIERWTRHRAIEFFKAFLGACANETGPYGSTTTADDMLTEILKDEVKSEILYESYRRVCLSKSKNIGPRIIGLLTAKLLNEEREASPEEELMFEAAEKMGDDDLLEFENFYTRNTETREEKRKSSTIEKVISEESIDSNWSEGRNFSLGPVNLAGEVGKWAQVMYGIGIIEVYMNERTTRYREDSERHIDQDGTLRTITWSISIAGEYQLFCDLIKRAT